MLDLPTNPKTAAGYDPTRDTGDLAYHLDFAMQLIDAQRTQLGNGLELIDRQRRDIETLREELRAARLTIAEFERTTHRA
jgi:hypothetical protein